MLKRRNRVYRRIAVALTVALLAGQSHAFVLAEEGDAPQTEISTEKTDTNTSDSGSETGGGSTDSGNTGEQQGDGDEQDKCVCEIKCAEDSVNTDCPVCAADFGACVGNEEDAGNNDTENNDTENDGQENNGDNTEDSTVGQECVCETACTEEDVNTECLVCAADYAKCAKNAGGGVNPAGEEGLEETLSEDEGIEAYADDGVEACAVGDAFTYNGIRYTVIGDGEVEIAGQDSNVIKGDIVIPASVKADAADTAEYRVTTVGQKAFGNCYLLTGIELPDSVVKIESAAFMGCGRLAKIEGWNNVTTIGSYAFENNIGLVDIKLPERLSSLDMFAFMGSSGLASIEIPDGVTSIGQGAFCYCSGLEKVTIPKSVTKIVGAAFSECSKLTSVELPDSITRIEEDAFYKCSSLTGIVLQSSVTEIGARAFMDSGLNTLKIMVPEGENTQIPQVGQEAFDGAPKGTLVLLAEDGSVLTGEPFEQAKRVYWAAGEQDGNPDDGKWYGWTLEEPAAVSLQIRATATEGGTIFPSGDISVKEGDDQPFTITPDEGNKIKAVTVDADTADEKDVTAELRDTQARAQTGTKYYTFSNVTKDHTIHAEFEKDGNGGGGGGDNSGGGSGGGGNTNLGGGNNQNPDGGNNGGGNNNGGNAGNGGGGTTPGGSNSTVNGQITAGTQAGSGAAGTSAGGNAASGGSAAGSAADGTASATSEQTAGGTGTTANGKEPKTGDASYLQVYATLAMIAGLTYLLLYVLEESRGMSEREKEAFVAAFIRWGKKGGAFRKGCAVIAIFCLLAYYHIIGKNVGGNALRGLKCNPS